MHTFFKTGIILSILIILLFTTTSCISLKKASVSSDTSNSNTSLLVGNWSMTRTGIDPSLPEFVPEVIVDQIIAKKATWTVTRSGDQLKISYGRNTWFNPLGIKVTAKSTTSSESDDHRSCVFNGGGNIKIDKLPGALFFISPDAANINNISVDYTDEVTLYMDSDDEMQATIVYQVEGTYKSGNDKENLDYSGEINYAGKRR